MELATWAVDPSSPIMATAIHDGHEMRPEVGAIIALDGATRLREEDPWTSELAASIGSHVAVHRSRFEVDLNRARELSVYIHPEHAWGLDVWRETPEPETIEQSLHLHDDFYRRLGDTLDDLANRHGGFVVYDVHSYNHRRQGPDAEPEPLSTNPTVNLGTGSLPPRWIPVADRFLASISRFEVGGEPVDARANVRFEGGYLASWVNQRYGQVGCALAIEFKKVFMDEWSGRPDFTVISELADALAGTSDDCWEASRLCR